MNNFSYFSKALDEVVDARLDDYVETLEVDKRYEFSEKYNKKINKENHTTIVMVTHDSLVASYSNRLLYLEDGKISKCLEKNNKTQEEYYRDIIAITTKMDLAHV